LYEDLARVIDISNNGESMKLKKVKGGLKNKGMSNAPWDKLGNQDSESAAKAPADQLKGAPAKKIKKD